MTRALTLGIDASNLRAGGGVTHLVGMLSAADLSASRFERVVVWGGGATLAALPDRPWLDPRREPDLDRSLAHRMLWQRRALPTLARAACDVLLCPGGTSPPDVRPHVVMCRNMLPFERAESSRYRGTPTWLRLEALRWAQSRAFERADGVIFLTEYAESAVRPILRAQPARTAIVPHGVDESLRLAPRPQRPLSDCTAERPLRLLYLSTIAPYKHPVAVVHAVAALRARGLPVSLELVGGHDHPETLRNLRTTLRTLDPTGRFLVYAGSVEHRLVAEKLHAADVFVFASSCENMPNILLEAMAAGLPIACADRGPMPEVLGAGGVYFDPERTPTLTDALERLVTDPSLRASVAAEAFARAARFSWSRCAAETLTFLALVAGS